MFQYDLSDTRDFNRKTDLEHSYYTFLTSIHQDRNTFPFELENTVFFKGKPAHFRIASFGGYMSEKGWRVYLTYRASRINHVKMHSWSWDNENDCAVDHVLNEFIG